MPYTHLTINEREYLYDSLKKGHSLRKIAEHMERIISTLSREIKRNSCDTGYKVKSADMMAKERRINASVRVLKPVSVEYAFVIEKLRNYWSPEAICGRWCIEYPERKRIHYTTIYRHIHQKRLPEITAQDNLRRRGKPPKSQQGGQMTIHPNRLIREWPEEIKTLFRIGDWEGDTITGKIGSGLITTLVDRKSRYLLAGKVESKHATIQRASIERLLKGAKVESLSLDNGVEFAEHEEIEKTLKIKVYFADPHSPWQQGSNENLNGVLRFFFPRGSDFSKITQEDVDKVVATFKQQAEEMSWMENTK